MPRWYIHLESGKPSGMSSGCAPVYSLRKFILDDSEIPYLETFLKETTLPFNKPFIQLAFDALIKSYTFRNRDRALSFILLVMGLEILFSDNHIKRGKDQVIAKRVSNILGGSVKDKRRIRKEIVKLYKIRSDIVHNDDFDIADTNDWERIRYYVRECIIKANIFDLSKGDLISEIDKIVPGEGAKIP